MSDNLDIPEFLKIPAEERAEAWRRNPPQAAPAYVKPLTDAEREALADRQRKAIEQHNRGYEMQRKFEALSPEDKALALAKRKLRRARR